MKSDPLTSLSERCMKLALSRRSGATAEPCQQKEGTNPLSRVVIPQPQGRESRPALPALAAHELALLTAFFLGATLGAMGVFQ